MSSDCQVCRSRPAGRHLVWEGDGRIIMYRTCDPCLPAMARSGHWAVPDFTHDLAKPCCGPDPIFDRAANRCVDPPTGFVDEISGFLAHPTNLEVPC